jgi:branched-chain amino acid transport system substrate-binding protein
MPRDATSADPGVIQNIAQEAVRDGAVAIIGPIFAQQVPAVAAKAAEVRAPVLAFSTDVSAFGQGAYLVSLTPYSEVERIVDWAMKDGVTRFAMLGPDNANGRTIEQALRQEVAERGGSVISVEYYQPGNASPQEQARRTATVVEAEHRSYPNKVAVLIPEAGVQLRSVGALLRAVMSTTPREIRFLGTGQWNDADVWREPAPLWRRLPCPRSGRAAGFREALSGDLWRAGSAPCQLRL